VGADVPAAGEASVTLRLLEIVPSLRRAGAEHVAAALARALPRGRFECAGASLYDPTPGGLERELEQAGVPVFHLGKRRGPDPRVWARLKRVIEGFAPGVIHTHSYVLRYALPVSGRARVVHTLHNLAGHDPDRLTAILNGVAFQRGVVPVAVSEAVARSFEGLYGMAAPEVIANGIDLKRFDLPGARERWRAGQGFGEDDFLVASVARLEPQKDPETLIRAFARLDGGYLLMAGDGTLSGAARRCALRCGVERRVRFLGARSDVPELLAASDVFALASRWEGSPVSVIEAMAAGLPVVATAVGGVPELVRHGECGLLVPPGSDAELGEALRRLASDPALRREFGAACRSRAAAFGAEAMADRYARFFERIAGEAR
jgi:glycosyltransferase involved in cell wall biosynthesis